MLATRSTLWLSNPVAKQVFRKSSLFFTACIILFTLPAVYLLTERPVASGNDPVQAARRYLTAVYARDYRKAYQWISAQDQRHKSATEYLAENPFFSGNALELALCSRPSVSSSKDVGHDQMIEGEDSLELLREHGQWRVFNNWGGAIRIRFSAEVKEGLPLEFWPVQDTVLAKPGEPLQTLYKVKNLSNKRITAKAPHRDEPRELADKYLQTAQCFGLIRQTLAPGEEKELPVVFRIRRDVPKEIRAFRVNYGFYPIEKFSG